MSDMYLVLRSKLEDVQSWITLGDQVMKGAQERVGLSDERVARQIPIATRTWIRWRQRGQVPAHALSRVAEILDLEVEQPESPRPRVEVPTQRDDHHLEEVRVRLDEIVTALERLTDRVDELAERRAPSRARR